MASSDYSELVDYDLADEVSQPLVRRLFPTQCRLRLFRVPDVVDLGALDRLADVTAGSSRLSDTNDLPPTSMVVKRSQSRANNPSDAARPNRSASQTQGPVSPSASPEARTSMSGEAANEIDRCAQLVVCLLYTSPSPRDA